MGTTTQPEKTEDSISTEEIDVTDIDLADGSASGPSLAFQNDDDLGLYRPGADRLGFTANGTRYVEVTDAAGGVVFVNQGGGLDPELGANDDGQTLTIVGDFQVEDDNAVVFGSGEDWRWQYDSTNTRVELTDGTNDLLRVDDGTTVVDFPNDIDVAGAASVATLDNDGSAISLGDSLTPDAANTHTLGSSSAEFADVFIGDDSALQLGSDQDWLIQYDSTNTRVELTDGTNDVFRVDDGTQIVDFQGGVNLANSNSIQDAGTDAFTFDGSGNVTAAQSLALANAGAGNDPILSANSASQHVAVQDGVEVFADGDTVGTDFPSVQVDSDGVKFGPGGGSGLDLQFTRQNSSALRLQQSGDSSTLRDLQTRDIIIHRNIRVLGANSVAIQANDSDNNSDVTVATLQNASTPTFDLDQARLTANLALDADASHDIGSSTNSLNNVFTSDLTTAAQRLTASQRVSSNTTLDNTDHLAVADTSGGTVTITLPGSPDDGRTIAVKRIGSNNVTVGRNGNNIDESASDTTIGNDGECLVFKFFSGQGWYVMSRLQGGGII